MIVGFEAKRAFKNKTGLGNYSRMLICGLASERKDVRSVLYASDMSGEYRGHFTGYANISTRKPSGLGRLFPQLWRGCGMTRLLKGDKVDLFHGLSHELPHGIPRSVKKVVTMHDLIVWRCPQYYRWIDRVIHRIKQRHACRIADAVVAISRSTRRDLIKYAHVPASKIHVVYQSCDPIFWRPVTEEEKLDVRRRYGLPKRYVVCVGTVEERKNQKAAVKALVRLPEDVHLVIVGRHRGRYVSEIKSEIRSLKIAGRVHFITNAAFEDFPALYANAEASVYVSRYEGFGIPILESLCCDTPVVASRVSSMPEAGGDAALYASPDNPGEIALHLRRIISDPQLRDQLVARGRIHRENFTQQKVIGDLYALYESLVPQEEDDF